MHVVLSILKVMEIVKVHDLDEYKKPLNEYFNFMSFSTDDNKNMWISFEDIPIIKRMNKPAMPI